MKKVRKSTAIHRMFRNIKQFLCEKKKNIEIFKANPILTKVMFRNVETDVRQGLDGMGNELAVCSLFTNSLLHTGVV